MKELLQQLGVKQLKTTAYHPQCDGLVERFNRTMFDMLASYVSDDPSNWDEYLNYVTSAHNTSVQASTNETPFYLLYGRDPLEPNDLNEPMRFRLTTNENNIFT